MRLGHQFQGQKVKLTRPINALTHRAICLLNGKAYELQTWCMDGGRLPASTTGTITSKVKGQGCKVMWSVWAVFSQCCTCVIRGRRGHTVSAKPGGHTSDYCCFLQQLRYVLIADVAPSVVCCHSHVINIVWLLSTASYHHNLLITHVICCPSHKAWYTLLTKLTVTETGDKLATKSTVTDTIDFVANTVDYFAGFGNKSATTWIRQFVVVDIVANSVNTVDFVADTVDFMCTGPKGHARLCHLSTKSTAVNSTLCTGLKWEHGCGPTFYHSSDILVWKIQ